MCYVCLYGSKEFSDTSTSSSESHFRKILNGYWQHNNPTNEIIDRTNRRTPASLTRSNKNNTTQIWSELLEKNTDISQYVNSKTYTLDRNLTKKIVNISPYNSRYVEQNLLQTKAGRDKTNIPKKQPTIHTTTAREPWKTGNTFSPHPNLLRTAKTSINANSKAQKEGSPQRISGGNFYYDGSTYSSDDAFNLSSNPNADKTIYLDFDGADLLDMDATERARPLTRHSWSRVHPRSPYMLAHRLCAHTGRLRWTLSCGTFGSKIGWTLGMTKSIRYGGGSMLRR